MNEKKSNLKIQFNSIKENLDFTSLFNSYVSLSNIFVNFFK